MRRATEPPGAARPAVEEDGQATALPDAAALVFVADCLPVLLATPTAVAALHGGWRGLAGGIVAEGVAALRELGADGPITAAIGPGARGCCYEVGEEVHAQFAGVPGARAGERNLDLPAIARHALERGRRRRDPRHGAVHDVRRRPVLLAPPRRRRHRPAGGGRVAGLSAARVRENAERIRAEIDAAARRAGRDPGDVELLAAVKYVERDDVGALLEAGLTLFGENRAQELEAKAAAWPDARWHFIGQLQSRKVKQILPLVELIHSVASDSALRQLERHATPETEILVEVNVAGEDGQGRDRAGRARRVHRARARPRRRADGDAAVRGGSGGRAGRTSPRCASSPPRTACASLSMGTSQDYAVAVEEGATIVRVGSVLFE